MPLPQTLFSSPISIKANSETCKNSAYEAQIIPQSFGHWELGHGVTRRTSIIRATDLYGKHLQADGGDLHCTSLPYS